MNNKKLIYNLFHKIGSVSTIVLLLWILVSTPYINELQSDISKQISMVEENNPLSGFNEERPHANASEYLHHFELTFLCEAIKANHDEEVNAKIYIAFYGELISPPPEC